MRQFPDLPPYRQHLFGVWRSPVAYMHGVHGVAGSNPVTPTNKSLTWECRTFFMHRIKRSLSENGIKKAERAARVRLLSGFLPLWITVGNPVTPTRLDDLTLCWLVLSFYTHPFHTPQPTTVCKSVKYPREGQRTGGLSCGGNAVGAGSNQLSWSQISFGSFLQLKHS